MHSSLDGIEVRHVRLKRSTSPAPTTKFPLRVWHRLCRSTCRTRKQQGTCATMSPAMSQTDADCCPAARRPRRGAWLRRAFERSAVLRLRRKGPRWMLVALLLLTTGNVALASLAWLVVEHVFR
jgi:hypothetical protein